MFFDGHCTFTPFSSQKKRFGTGFPAPRYRWLGDKSSQITSFLRAYVRVCVRAVFLHHSNHPPPPNHHRHLIRSERPARGVLPSRYQFVSKLVISLLLLVCSVIGVGAVLLLFPRPFPISIPTHFDGEQLSPRSAFRFSY